MKNTIIGLTVTAVISIIMITAVLIPFLGNASESNNITYTNYGYGAELADESISYTWAAGTGVTIGENTITNSADNGPQVFFMSDGGYAKANFAGTSASFYGNTSGAIAAGSGITGVTITVNPSSKTVVLSNIIAATTIDDVTLNYTSWCFVPSLEPTHVMYAPYSTTKTMYSSEDIYAYYKNGNTWAMSFKGSDQTWEYGSPTYTTDFDGTSIEGYTGLTKYDILSNTGDYSVTVSDSVYTPEAMVFGLKATGIGIVGHDAIELLRIVPILIVAGVIIGIATVAVSRRD